MGCGLVPLTAAAFPPAGDGFGFASHLDPRPPGKVLGCARRALAQHRCAVALHHRGHCCTELLFTAWAVSCGCGHALPHGERRRSAIHWGGLSSGIPPSGAQPLPAATGQGIALAGLVFVGAHQATGPVPALSWCRCDAEAAFVAWDLAEPSHVRPGRKRAGQLKEGAGPVCCRVLVLAHRWFAGRFQDGLVPVFGSFL